MIQEEEEIEHVYLQQALNEELNPLYSKVNDFLKDELTSLVNQKLEKCYYHHQCEHCKKLFPSDQAQVNKVDLNVVLKDYVEKKYNLVISGSKVLEIVQSRCKQIDWKAQDIDFFLTNIDEELIDYFKCKTNYGKIDQELNKKELCSIYRSDYESDFRVDLFDKKRVYLPFIVWKRLYWGRKSQCLMFRQGQEYHRQQQQQQQELMEEEFKQVDDDFIGIDIIFIATKSTIFDFKEISYSWPIQNEDVVDVSLSKLAKIDFLTVQLSLNRNSKYRACKYFFEKGFKIKSHQASDVCVICGNRMDFSVILSLDHGTENYETNITALGCTHLFHRKCLRQLVDYKKLRSLDDEELFKHDKSLCPSCQVPIDPIELMDLIYKSRRLEIFEYENPSRQTLSQDILMKYALVLILSNFITEEEEEEERRVALMNQFKQKLDSQMILKKNEVVDRLTPD